MLAMMNIGSSGMKVQELQMQNIANGLANVNTFGFKGQRCDFQDQWYQTLTPPGAPTDNGITTPEGTQLGSGVLFAGTTSNFTQGTVLPTGKPTDLAIDGEGWFVIEKNGQKYLTRDGRFKTDLNGLLVNGDGYPVVPNITVAQGSTNLSISSSGMVSAVAPGQTNAAQIGQIQLAMVANNQGLLRVGKGLWMTSTASGDSQQNNPGENGSGTIQAGALESSNASIVDLMVDMITSQRAFEANSKTVQTGNDLLGIVVNLKK